MFNLADYAKNFVTRNYCKNHTCPECHGILRKCGTCDGSGKVTKKQLDAYHNPIAELLRRRKK